MKGVDEFSDDDRERLRKPFTGLPSGERPRSRWQEEHTPKRQFRGRDYQWHRVARDWFHRGVISDN